MTLTYFAFVVAVMSYMDFRHDMRMEKIDADYHKMLEEIKNP